MNLPQLQYPTYEVTLISNNTKVSYRPFLVKEHKVLMTLKNADANEVARIIKELVNVCTFGKLNVEELAYFDVEYLFLQIRAKSIGEIVDVNVNCECGNKVKTNYNIENLTIEKHDHHTNKIMLDGSIGLLMKYPNIDKTISVFESEDREIIDDLILSSIEAIYDKDNYWDASTLEKEELQSFIDGLQKKHFEAIEQFFLTSPQVVQVIEAKCDQCGNDIKAKLKGLYNFFI